MSQLRPAASRLPLPCWLGVASDVPAVTLAAIRRAPPSVMTAQGSSYRPCCIFALDITRPRLNFGNQVEGKPVSGYGRDHGNPAAPFSGDPVEPLIGVP